MRKGLAVFFLMVAATGAEPVPQHEAPDAGSAPAQPSPPEGLTKNMIYLEFVTVLGVFQDWFKTDVTVLTDGRSKYCVYGVPAGQYATEDCIPKVILVPGRVLEILNNRRAYRWFSAGTITPELVEAYRKDHDLDYPLGN